MESFKLKRRLNENGTYKIPNDVVFSDKTDSQILKYNLELNIGNDMKLISAILSYISHKHYRFLSLKKLEVYLYIDSEIYVTSDGLKSMLSIYNINNFYLNNDILYRFNDEEELNMFKRGLKIRKILDNKKKALHL
jgi:hypothetical protein